MELFEPTNAFPDGFSYTPDFITPAEEQELLDIIATIPLETFMFQGFAAKRKTASFGYDYSFDNRKLKKGKPIPAEFDKYVARVAEHIAVDKEEIAELLVTEYPPGAVINWHRDAPPFDVIAGISLLSGCVFRMRPYGEQVKSRASVLSMPVGRRSIYVMKGEMRENWQHSISPVRALRYSVTFRTLRRQ
jgi:alkylated DNA repair dioxygenase AlkB